MYIFDDFVGWVVHQIVFFVARNSDSELSSTPNSKSCISYPNKDIALTPISFRCSPLVVPSIDIVAIRNPVSLKTREHVDLLLLPYRYCITLHLNANLDRTELLLSVLEKRLIRLEVSILFACFFLVCPTACPV